MRNFSNTSISVTNSKLKAFTIENHISEFAEHEYSLSIVISTTVSKISSMISNISKIANFTINIKNRENSIVTTYINCMKAKRRKIAIEDTQHANVICENLAQMKYDITQEKYAIFKMNNYFSMIEFTIKYLHSTAKFDTITTAILSISICLLSVKFVNLLSNDAMTKTSIDIARNTIKLKH